MVSTFVGEHIIIHHRGTTETWPEGLPNYDPQNPLYGHDPDVKCLLCEEVPDDEVS